MTPDMQGHPAGFASRLVAELIDVLIISVTFVTTTWFVSVTATMLQFRIFLGFSINMVPGSTEFIDWLFSPASAGFWSSLYVFGYHVFFWSLTGQTPGKALLGLRVVPIEGGKLTPWRAMLRMAGYLLSALPFYLGFVWILLDDRRLAWHDRLARTTVVYTWEARHDEKFLSEEIQNIQAAKR